MNLIIRIITFCIILVFVNQFVTHAQSDDGIIFVENQTQLDALTQPGGALYLKNTIEGSLYIGNRNRSEGSDIINLKPLASITSIKGALYIMSNLKLISLGGLEGVKEVESIYIKGNPLLTSLAGLSNITFLSGDLEIAHNTHLTSLAGFESLATIKGSLEIFLNSSLCSLTGLNNLATIDDYLLIDDNDALTTVKDLGVISVGDFNIRNNEMLTSFFGLQLNSVDDIVVASNASLTSLAGLEKIKSISGGVLIYKNYSMTTLTGMRNVIAVGGSLDIWGNTSLASLEGLSNIVSVGKELHIADNPYLTNLSGLEGIVSVGSLSIENNQQVNDFCAIDRLIDTMKNISIEDIYRVKYNKYNPTLVDFGNGECSSNK